MDCVINHSTVHEGTLLECMEVISAWANALPDQCPPQLSKYIKTGLASLKGAVRLGLCRLMADLYTDKHTKWLTEIVDAVCKCVEKALAQPAVVHKFLKNMLLLQTKVIKKILSNILCVLVFDQLNR